MTVFPDVISPSPYSPPAGGGGEFTFYEFIKYSVVNKILFKQARN